MKAVILAAGVGSRLMPLTSKAPKCLLKVGGITLLDRMISNICDCGITDIIFVLGYMHDTVKSYVTNKYPNIRAIFILNKKYLETNTAYSLMLAKQVMLGSEFIKFDADVVFDKKILQNILRTKSPNCICIDKSVHMNNEEIKVICNTSGTVSKIGKSLEPEKALGESIGIEKISSTTAYILFQELETMMEDINNHQKYYESAYERIISKGMIFNIINITGLNWVEIDTLKDLKNAQLIFRDPQA